MLNREDKADVKRHFGGKMASKVAKATNDAKGKALSKRTKLFDSKFRNDKSRGVYAGKSLEAAMDYESRRQERNK